MCTVSVVPRDTGFRLVCNRDQRLARPAADPPRLQRFGNPTAMWPRDPTSGGTWIGANDRGIAMAVLNRNSGQPPMKAHATVSRGTIVPQLLRIRTVTSVMASAAALPAERFEPFTLLVLQGRALAVITNVNGRMTIATRRLSVPIVFTSSSLGDHFVDGPRRALFASLVEESEAPLAGQALFHRHCWPDRPEISVLMSRTDAATVSRTVLDVTDSTIAMRYTRI